MKLATVEGPEGQTIVCAMTRSNALLDLRSAAPGQTAFHTMQDLIEAGPQALEQIKEMLDGDPSANCLQQDQVRFLAPLPLPNSIRDFANFELHVQQALETSMRTRAASEDDPQAAYERFKASGAYDIPAMWYDRPYYFKGNRMTAVGHESTIQWPRFTNTMDYELELAAIIGTKGVNIAHDDALSHVFGYTIYNDFSARDEQVRDQQFRMGPSKGKDFDTGNAFGPWIVTRDEIGDPQNLKMVSRINGVIQGEANSSGMQHSFADCIAFISRDETLYPGDVLGSGTAGNGCGFETGRYLDPGDVIELDVEGLGILRNTISERTA